MTHPANSVPSSNGGYVSSEVIWLKLEHLSSTVDVLGTNLMQEVRLLRTEVVRRDVYEEQRRADQAELQQLRQELARRADKSEADQVRQDLARVKEEMKERKARGWAVWLALTVAGFALLKDLASSLIQ
jgi:hypothetical protein